MVDLPGYGYARVSITERVQWGRLLEHYLLKREALVGVILIMDIRLPLTALDEQLIEWVAPRALPVHILLSKADKLSAAKALAAKRSLERELAERGHNCSVQLFSSFSREGIERAQEIIGGWLSLNSIAPPAVENGCKNKNPRLKGSKAGGKMP